MAHDITKFQIIFQTFNLGWQDWQVTLDSGNKAMQELENMLGKAGGHSIKSDAENGSDAADDDVTEIAEDKDKDREARAAASIKEREKEVQRALANSLRDRDKEREYHKRDEAQQHFNALLADLVRNADLTWREAKKVLKKDHRYSLAELLSKEDKERLFTAHTGILSNKRREKLRTLLDELGVTPTHHWRDLKKTLKNDARAPTYASQEKMEREFREYQRDLITNAKSEFRQLLLESRSLTHKSLAAVKASKDGLTSILDLLRQDARFSALDCVEDERTALVEEHLEELQRRGPPPPPTATDPPRPRK